jgi:hypothetical protein
LLGGRGSAARAAAATPGADDLIFECIRADPRWDRQIESRSLYYARLVLDLELPIEPIAAHLADPVDQLDQDEWRTWLAIGVLADLVRLSRREAAEPLRRYAWEGWNWYAALDALVGLDDPDLVRGLDEMAVARCDDDDLLGLVLYDAAVIDDWAARHRRIAEVREVRRARAAARRDRRRRAMSDARSDADLLALARHADAPRVGGNGDGAPADPSLAAIIELGRRRSPLVLDLAEELLPLRPQRCRGALFRALRELGPVAVPRARTWAADCRRYAGADLDIDGDVRFLARHGVRILAQHGTEQDIPVLLDCLHRALAAADWAGAATPVHGLGRLRAAAALPLLRAAWQPAAYSFLRPRLLTAMHAVSPEAAGPYATEALWDCEDQARDFAATVAPLDADAELRLRRLRAERAEDPGVRATATGRLRSARLA